MKEAAGSCGGTSPGAAKARSSALLSALCSSPSAIPFSVPLQPLSLLLLHPSDVPHHSSFFPLLIQPILLK